MLQVVMFSIWNNQAFEKVSLIHSTGNPLNSFVIGGLRAVFLPAVAGVRLLKGDEEGKRHGIESDKADFIL